MNKILDFKQIDDLIDLLSNKIKQNNKFKSIALIGDLGTGKTYISKRICKNLGVKENVKSPTFTYLLEYNTDNLKIVHFDLYRLSNIDELYEIGYDEYIEDNSLFLIEWANNIPEAIPDNTLYIELIYSDVDKREVSIYKLEKGEKKYVELINYNFN